ncbi:metal ABC transporter substrate-binding protein [Hoyosella subflava]|uniref:Putative ABC transporter substrate-binding protein n=1 Tax=Hoyosella subflava (strain DSM 45089 / JCM 17490 / NBRC 109087 / DQS3-9A1) TaxID=443218 RepID=F6EJQ9_HOYSD|nr:Putative ABC transporter substrate-binding protein [Hoyosella subflava DQS3-9A1]
MTNFPLRSPKVRFWRTLIAATATMGIAAVVACSAPAASDADDERPLVLTTFTVLADMGQNVAGDHFRVESITKPGAEIHGYEPTPSDMRTAENAALILDNGLGLESWFERFVTTVRAPHAVVTEGIEPIAIRGGEYEGQANPHAWMSPTDAQVYVDNIAHAFADLDPANSEDFYRNAESYKTEIAAIGDDLVSALAELPEGQRALVTCEGAFSYLTRDTGLQEGYLWAVNQEQEGTPRQVADLVNFVRSNNVPAVFCESTVSDRAQRQVARETGAEFGGVLYVDSLSGPDGPVPTYLDLLRHSADVIVEGLTGS